MSKATKILLPIVGLVFVGGAIAAAAIVVPKLLGGGGDDADYFTAIAEMAPEDALGVIAVRDFETALAGLGERMDDDIREAAEDDLGVDIFDPETMREWGFDFSRPSGMIALGAEPPVFAIILPTSMGGEEMRDHLVDIIEDLDRDNDDDQAEPDETEIEDYPALINDEAVVIFRDDDIVIVGAEFPFGTEDTRDDMEDYATDFIEYDGDAFSTIARLDEAVAFSGDTHAIAAGSVSEILPLIPDAAEMLETVADHVEIAAIALASSDNGLTFTARAPAEDEEAIEVFTEAPAWGDALDYVPSPVAGAIRMRINVEQAVENAMEAMAEQDGFEDAYDQGLAGVEAQTGIDIEDDFIPLLTGEIGVFVQEIPPSEDPTQVRLTVFIGVNDEEAANELLEDAIESAPAGMIEVEETDAGDMYVVPIGPRPAFGVHNGYLWVTVDDDALLDAIDGDIDSILGEDDDEDAVALLTSDANVAFFLPISDEIREQLTSGADDPFAEMLFETVSFVSATQEMDGNVGTAQITLGGDPDGYYNAVVGAFASGIAESINRSNPEIIEVPDPDTANGDPPPTQGNNGVPPTQGNNGVPPTQGNTGVPPTQGSQDHIDEARANLARIVQGAVAHYQRTSSFPSSTERTPSASVMNVACASGGMMTVNPSQWSSGSWSTLGFQPDTQHRFTYHFTASGEGNKASFTAAAFGDLDCDGRISTFQQFGAANGSGGINLSEVQSRHQLE